MLSRLQKELDEFLIEYNISGDTSIFPDVLFQLAGVSISSGARDYGFLEYLNRQNENHLVLTIPSLTLADLRKILTFCKVPKQEYQTTKPIKITEDLLFNHFLPAFEEYIFTTWQENPQVLKPYIRESKAILEKKAIDNMVYSSRILLDVIKAGNHYVDEHWRIFSSLLFELNGILDALDRKSDYYTDVIRMDAEINCFLFANPVISDEKQIEENLLVLRAALQAYVKYNRAESALAITQLFNELNEFLEKFEIRTSECNIFGDIVLAKAGVQKKVDRCTFEPGLDRTRMAFRIVGITKEDTKKLVNYLHFSGDETAKECDVYRFELRMRDTYQVEVDGLALYNNILPVFKQQVSEWAKSNKHKLAPYKEASSYFFIERKSTIPSSKASATLFKPAQARPPLPLKSVPISKQDAALIRAAGKRQGR